MSMEETWTELERTARFCLRVKLVSDGTDQMVLVQVLDLSHLSQKIQSVLLRRAHVLALLELLES